MAFAIAEGASTGADLRDDGALDLIVERWNWWARNPKDIGVQTHTVLSNAAERGISAKTARDESSALYERTGRTAGNGSLMRTAPVALAHLDDEEALVMAARRVSELTHFDPDAGDACVLWSTGIRHAILTGDLDARVGLGHIDIQRRDVWLARINEAEERNPRRSLPGAAGWWQRCRRPGRRSSQRPSRWRIRLRKSFVPTIYDWCWRLLCEAVGTPTRWQRLQVR